MKPLDPRLLRYATAARSFLAAGAVMGLVQTAATVAFAFFVSQAVVAVVDGRVRELPPLLLGLGITVLVRSGLLWALEAVAARAAVRVKSQLRERLVATIAARGRSWVAAHGSARLATLVGPGLDALDEYFAKYLPQLILTALATPLLVVVLFTQDLLSGVIVVVTLPLIPIFMILIGWTTRSAQARQWDRLARLATAFLDAVGGLSTLKAFGRERRQIRRIGAITDEYRSETMKVLQVSFLSGFALEMAASLSVALVAVAIGVRLVSGSLDLSVGLFLLLLTPEAYLPLRQVGANFHAAADGVAAAEAALDVLGDSTDVPIRDDARADDPSNERGGAVGIRDVVAVRGLAVAYGDRSVLHDIDVDLRVGEVLAVTGASGVGKSTLLAALLGTVEHRGHARWGADGPGLTHADIAWSGQRPGLSSGTVAANVALGDDVHLDEVLAALETAGGKGIDPGADLGPGGSGLSGGQAQRVALARAVYRVRRRNARVLLVDEPSSALDPVTEGRMIAGLRAVAAEGVAVVVVTHRPAVAAAADRALNLTEHGLMPAPTPTEARS